MMLGSERRVSEAAEPPPLANARCFHAHRPSRASRSPVVGHFGRAFCNCHLSPSYPLLGLASSSAKNAHLRPLSETRARSLPTPSPPPLPLPSAHTPPGFRPHSACAVAHTVRERQPVVELPPCLTCTFLLSFASISRAALSCPDVALLSFPARPFQLICRKSIFALPTGLRGCHAFATRCAVLAASQLFGPMLPTDPLSSHALFLKLVLHRRVCTRSARAPF